MLFEELPLLFEEVLDLELVVELIQLHGVDPRPESAAERSDAKHWPILGAFWRQAAAQGFVDDLLEWNVEQLRPLLEDVGEIVVQGEGGSHAGIKASLTRDVKVFARSARTLTATEFRAKCLGVVDEVAQTGREIVTTKRGRPVVRLVRVRRPCGRLQILPVGYDAAETERKPHTLLNPRAYGMTA